MTGGHIVQKSVVASHEVREIGQTLDCIAYVWVAEHVWLGTLRSKDFILSKIRNHWRILSRETY